MSFRQNNHDLDVVRSKRSRSLLIETRMPARLVDDDRSWIYVLLHGDVGSGWSPRSITRQQAWDMLALLESHFENEAGLGLFTLLRRRIDGA
jgi:hypothetical protein